MMAAAGLALLLEDGKVRPIEAASGKLLPSWK